MTKKRLEEYRSAKEEISELSEKIRSMEKDEAFIKADTVLDYRTGQGIPKRIMGFDVNAYWKKRRRYAEKLEALQKECDEVEEWIEAIEDSMTRRVFRMAYVDGLSQTTIGAVLHLDRSRISRKITDYLRACEKKV